MATNYSLPLSASGSTGLPIQITSTSNPGTLLHEADSDKNFIWLYLGLPEVVSTVQPIYVTIVKGKPASGYIEDTTIHVPSGKKTLVESGVLISDINLYAYINSASSILSIPVSATGYVHRRVE
jgi:hypothetical protein